MKLVTAVNICLRGVSSSLANEADSGNRTSATAIDAIARKQQELLSKGWDFNTRRVTLVVNTAGRVQVPRSYLGIAWPSEIIGQVDPDDPSKTFVWNKRSNKFHDIEVVNLPVSLDIPDFENLPFLFANWLAHEAAALFYREVNNGNDPPRALLADLVRAQSTFMNHQPAVSIDEMSGFTASTANITGRPVRVGTSVAWI